MSSVRRKVLAKATPFTEDSYCDLVLVDNYLSGDERAFSHLYLRYKEKLMRFVNSIIRDRERSEELVQETFFRVYRHIHNFNPKKKFSTWIFTIASNLSKNELRDKRRKKTLRLEEPFDGEEDFLLEIEDKNLHPERLMNGRIASEALSRALERLPYNKRKIFLLRKFGGKTIAEVAGIMKCPTGTVKSSVNRVTKLIGPKLMQKIS